VDDSAKYQEIDGFGASLTESSAYLLKRKLGDAQRSDALRMLFDRQKGIGLSMLRQPMGASDFALGAYSYDEVPEGETDPGPQEISRSTTTAPTSCPYSKKSLPSIPRSKSSVRPGAPPAG
jgi:glucosylceramidase